MRQEQCEQYGHAVEVDEISRFLVGELVLDREEHDRVDDRVFECVEVVYEYYEDHVGGVLHIEDRRRLDEQCVG